MFAYSWVFFIQTTQIIDLVTPRGEGTHINVQLTSLIMSWLLFETITKYLFFLMVFNDNLTCNSTQTFVFFSSNDIIIFVVGVFMLSVTIKSNDLFSH